MTTSKMTQEERQKLKQQAVEYFHTNDVPARMETLLNKMFHERPVDIYGYTAQYFARLAKPATYSKLTLEKTIGSSGLTAIQVLTYCMLNGAEKFILQGDKVNIQAPVAQLTIPTGPQQSGGGGGGKKTKQQTPVTSTATASNASDENGTDNEAEEEAAASQPTTVADLLATCQLEEVVSPRLVGKDPCDYAEISRILCDISSQRDDDNTELLSHECHLAVSLAAFQTASQLQNEPPYQCLMPSGEEDQPHSLPLLMIPVIAGGFLANGKLRWKEFYLAVGSSAERPMLETVQLISSIYQHLAVAISDKFGVASTSVRPETGAYVPPLDKPEQAFELLSNAVSHSGGLLGEDVYLVANIAATDLYDADKAKYEIFAGQWKNSGDAIGQLADVVTSHSPALAMLIDPLQDKAPDDWKTLQERVGKTCVLAAQGCCQDLTVEDICSSIQAELTPACVVNFQKTPVPHVLVNCIKRLQENGTALLSCLNQLTSSTLLMDVAVAADCNYVILQAPTRQADIYSRLVHIEEELKVSGSLTYKRHIFQMENMQAEQEVKVEEAAPANKTEPVQDTG